MNARALVVSFNPARGLAVVSTFETLDQAVEVASRVTKGLGCPSFVTKPYDVSCVDYAAVARVMARAGGRRKVRL